MTTDLRVNGTIREFSELDWDGMAGASRFADGSQPLIADIVLDGETGELVGDAECLQVIIYREPDEDWTTLEPSVYNLGLAAPRFVVAATMAKILAEVTTVKQLLDLGFSSL